MPKKLAKFWVVITRPLDSRFYNKDEAIEYMQTLKPRDMHAEMEDGPLLMEVVGGVSFNVTPEEIEVVEDGSIEELNQDEEEEGGHYNNPPRRRAEPRLRDLLNRPIARPQNEVINQALDFINEGPPVNAAPHVQEFQGAEGARIVLDDPAAVFEWGNPPGGAINDRR